MSIDLPNLRRIERPDPLIKANGLVAVAFERIDLASMAAFLSDFGFEPLTTFDDGRVFFRGAGENPYCVELIPSSRDAFIGLTFSTSNAADLNCLAQTNGVAIETADMPGGGSRVRLRDPDGWRIDVIHGFAPIAALSLPQPLGPVNSPFEARRINSPVRTQTAPAPVIRMGHVVLQTADFAATSQWYMRQLGLIPSDVQVTPDGTPALAFCRLDRDQEPADHHTVAILAGPGPAMLHVSTETIDLDTIGQGQQFLRERGWNHHWGIGRHILGSQIFDYWRDPAGAEWEHYADGDMMTADYPTSYHPLNRGGLWAWGDDLPDGLRPPDGAGDGAPPAVRALIQALQIPPRSWLR